jgi:FimV-like protein
MRFRLSSVHAALLASTLFLGVAPLGHVHAVALGKATVLSYLNQPLQADIQLIGLDTGQEEDLRLRVANQEHFERLGIDYTHFLASMRFAIVEEKGQWLVRVSTSKPVTEPFVDFPLQVAWPGGQLVKQYTLLLDPQTRPAEVRSAQVAATAARQNPAPGKPAANASALAAGSVYGPVRRGETLWPIAKRLKPAGITTRQMAIALLRANPQAFIDGNVNRLRAGSRLEVPPRGFIEEMDAAAARAEFSRQVKRWQAPVATSPRTLNAQPRQTAETDASPIGEKAAAAEQSVAPQPEPQAPADDQLRIVADTPKAEIENGSEQDLKNQLLVTMEEIESNQIATDAIEVRLARLEAELSRMQKLVELKDAQIRAMQSEVAARSEIEAAARTADPTPPVAAIPATPAQPPADSAKTTVAEPVVTVQSTPPVPQDPTSAWYEQYLWIAWVILGLLGLTALVALFRRPDGDSTAELPEASTATTAAYHAKTEPPLADLRSAERDLRNSGGDEAPAARETAAPSLDIELPVISDRDGDIDIESALDQLAGHHLDDDAIDELSGLAVDPDKKAAADAPPKASTEHDFSDDDIASWVAELGTEGDSGDKRSANDDLLAETSRELPLDDDLPSLLHELDDHLAKGIQEDKPSPASAINLEPLENPTLDNDQGGETAEDDTLDMSLDLARAYLEIGDQEGARDMLEQALTGARNPQQRQQIEELLKQIG